MDWTIVSVVIGGVLAAASGIVTTWFQYRHERKALVQAFAGEIGAITAIIRRRNYLGQLEGLLDCLKRGRPVVPKKMAAQSYFRIYEANAGRIGLMPRGQADDIARFYTFAISLIEDVTTNRPDGADVDAAVRFLSELMGMLRELLELGDSIILRLNIK